MKYYIEFNLKYRKSIYSHVSQVVENLFATLGAGISLDQRGYLQGNYRDEECYNFGDPVPLKIIYPWSKNEKFQPFRKLAGCRDIGFKETAQYFIDCVKITPDDVEYIKDWKSNIHIVEDVLLNTPPITDPYMIDDIDVFLDDIKNDKMTSQHPVDGTVINPINSVEKVWFFDVQWSDCPVSVENEVRHMWSTYELGNDKYMYQGELNIEFFNEFPRIYFWLVHKGVKPDEKFIIHWWW